MVANELDVENPPDKIAEDVHVLEIRPPEMAAGDLVRAGRLFHPRDRNLCLQKSCLMQAISQTSNLQDYYEGRNTIHMANRIEMRTAMLVDIAPVLLTPWLGKHVRADAVAGEPERKWGKDKHWHEDWHNKGPKCTDGPRCLCCQQKKAGLHEMKCQSYHSVWLIQTVCVRLRDVVCKQKNWYVSKWWKVRTPWYLEQRQFCIGIPKVFIPIPGRVLLAFEEAIKQNEEEVISNNLENEQTRKEAISHRANINQHGAAGTMPSRLQ